PRLLANAAAVARLGAIFFSWQKLKNSSGLMKTGIMLTPSRLVAVPSLSAFFSHSSKTSGSVSPSCRISRISAYSSRRYHGAKRVIDPEAIADDGPVCPRAIQTDRAHFRTEGLDQELAQISPLQWLFSSTSPPSQQRADAPPPPASSLLDASISSRGRDNP